MKRLCTLTLMLAAVLTCSAQAVQSAADSIRQAFFNEIEEGLPALAFARPDSVIALADKLMAVMGDSEDSTRLAGLFFNYFSDCPVMGTEAVAVHIADRYFLSGKLKWPDSDSYPLLYTFAEFNRASLIGKSAPGLVLEDIDGATVDMRAVRSPYKVLYFYDDACASCARQTPALVSLLNGYDGNGEVSLFAIYTQSGHDQWKKYVAANFDAIDNPKVTVYNLWDPEIASGFQVNYGVLTTPAMFLIDSENTITGRKLDSDALGRLLDIRDGIRTSLLKLFDTVTTEVGADEESAMQLAAALLARSSGDLASFKTTIYEMFRYYRSIPLADAQKGARKIAEDFILSVPESWAAETVSEVQWNLQKMQQNAVGQKAADEILLNKKGARKRMLAGCKPYTVLFFNIAGCNDCRQYTEALREAAPLLKARKVRVVSVYLSPDRSRWAAGIKADKSWTHLTDEGPASQLREDYDLGVVPRIYLLDRHKTVVAKDITVQTLCTILENQ